jgi:hypothetical protein
MKPNIKACSLSVRVGAGEFSNNRSIDEATRVAPPPKHPRVEPACKQKAH